MITHTKPALFKCHSGGAIGADTYFENIGLIYGIETLAYSYQTPSHRSSNKVEISLVDYLEGIEKIHLANQSLKRKINYKHLNLVSRNWQQIKNADQVFAISKIIYKNIECVSGGTGWAIQMAIDHEKEIFVFDQLQNTWFEWSYDVSRFCLLECCPKITYINSFNYGMKQNKRIDRL
jgi:hypothetical protein